MGEPRQFLRRVNFAVDGATDRYPFNLPVVDRLLREGGLEIPGGVTFFVGENGSGKSTVIEAIAVAAGLNPEGGSRNYRFATRASESDLGESTRLVWGAVKPRDSFFLRAESFYNMATETEKLGPGQIVRMGGVSLHERSHGESFIDVMRERFYPNGLYVMDEPEAALSPRGCLSAIALMADLVNKGCQIIVATHSPILLALPGATIYEFDEYGDIETVAYDDALPVRLTRSFLESPDRFLRQLLPEDQLLG